MKALEKYVLEKHGTLDFTERGGGTRKGYFLTYVRRGKARQSIEASSRDKLLLKLYQYYSDQEGTNITLENAIKWCIDQKKTRYGISNDRVYRINRFMRQYSTNQKYYSFTDKSSVLDSILDNIKNKSSERTLTRGHSRKPIVGKRIHKTKEGRKKTIKSAIKL